MTRGQVGIYGRDVELATLRAAWDAAARRGRLVVLQGPAGIGKSALLDAAEVAWLPAAASVIATQAEADRGDTFGLDCILRAVRSHFEQLGDLRVADSIGAVARSYAAADQRSKAWISRVVRELGVLFERIGALHPTALLVDDAHLIAEPAPMLTAARRPGCLVVVVCRDDEPIAGRTELISVADDVIDLAPLADEHVETLAAQGAGMALDDAVLPAMRGALGPLYGNPGTILATLGELRARGRLVPVHGRLCLRNSASPIPLPAADPMLRQVRDLGHLGWRLLTAVAVLGEWEVDELAVVAESLGETVLACGRMLDRLVEIGVVAVDTRGRVRCPCDTLAASVLEQAGTDATDLHAAVARVLLRRYRDGAWSNLSVLADHIADAGPGMEIAGDEVRLLVDQADMARDDDPARAVRWYQAALRVLRPDDREHSRILTNFLHLVVRTGRYEWVYELLAEHPAIGALDAQVRADLRAVAMLAAVHTGHPLPEPAMAALREEQPTCGDPVGFYAWWFGEQASWTPVPDDAYRAERPVLSAQELDVVRQALVGDPDACGRALRRIHGKSAASEVDLLLEAGSLSDLATVFEIVLGARYRVPRAGVLTAYQRVVRCYADAEWSKAVSAVREMEVTSRRDTQAHQAARLLAAEICSARGDFRRAAEWLSAATPELRLGGLRGWVDSGLLHRNGESRLAALHGIQACRRLRSYGVRAGLERLLIRTVEIATTCRERDVATEALAEIEDLHRLGMSRSTMETVFLARGMVRGDLVYTLVGADLAKGRGYRPDLIRPWLVAAQLADDPQAKLHEAYEVARQCESPLLREHIRAVSRDRGLSAPRARVQRKSLSETELRIVELLREGRTNRQIASDLQVSEKTVENQLTRLFARTGCRSRVELAAMSLEGRLPAAVSS